MEDGVFQLGKVAFRAESGELSNGTANARLEPQPAAVLAALARRQGAVVARQDLLDACWGAGSGSDEALTQSIAQCRRALAELGEAELVETLARRGYRLKSEAPADDVPMRSAALAKPLRRKPVLLVGAGVLALLLAAWVAFPHAPRHFFRHALGLGPPQQQGAPHGR